jgi:hypothetical protein
MFRTLRWTTRMRVLLAVVGAMAVGSAAYGFTATNTVPASQAGDGSGVISGYTISAIHYTLSGANATGVSFTTAPAVPIGGNLNGSVTLSAGGPVALNCGAMPLVAATSNFTCTFTSTGVSLLTGFQITAAQ